MSQFIDRVTIHATAGNGGHGETSVRREKFKPLGGPDGGNGGHGGDVVLVADPDVTTLLDYHHQPHRKATNGEPGKGDLRHGKNGETLYLPVPVGTVLKDDDGNILHDMVTPGEEIILAHGGTGGAGNASLASPKRKAPGFALLGIPGEERSVTLELKTVADIALVGFPSAGKSSLIAAISAARPKIADYPFTTLIPNLGVVEAGDVRYTVADVPGLIEGASEGRGLGLEFLRHVERCKALVHVVDCATLDPGRDPLSDIDIIEAELVDYGGLDDRPRMVALNKVDVPEARELAGFVRAEVAERGWPVFEVSAVSREGLREWAFAMGGLVAEARAAMPPAESTRIVLRPKAVDDDGFVVTAEEDRFRIRGAKPERWIQQTDFANDEAIGYLADRLSALGVEDALVKAGAVPGDEVVIGGEDAVIFDWDPSLGTGAEHLGPRGSDARLDD